MADIFISYASEDREAARQLARALEECGWSVWWDRKILAGQTFDQVIERELESAKCVVVLWSPASVVSEWVKNEAAVAAERGVLVPAAIAVVKLPLEFRRRQTADLIGWHGNASHAGFQALRAGITAVVTGVPPPLPPHEKPQPRQGNSLSRIAVVALFIIAFGLGGYLLWPQPEKRDFPSQDEFVGQITEMQQRVIELIEQRHIDDATALIERGLRRVDIGLERFPESAALYTLRGYLLKDQYQSSKNRLPDEHRREYLAKAEEAFQHALRLDPRNAGAHNGLGNIFFFLGNFNAAIEHHSVALELAHGNYPAAEHDKRLAEQVRDGRIPFDF
ncbi:MAG: TIR domain-containing protein [Candidatus Binatia bacterium]